MTGTILESDVAALDLLLEKVYQDGGYDFREYKRGTVIRRLERRLHDTGTKTYLDYIEFLENNPEEYSNLAEELTIKTSGFFRSPYTFEQVRQMVLPELIAYKRKQGNKKLRVWSTACARGEEPYSIAILLAELLGSALTDFDILIQATDISRKALEYAQVGVYSAKDVDSLDDNILRQYFDCYHERYEVRADIKKMLHLSYFDLTVTIVLPFVNFDCIFCCNVLIYLQEQLQARLLSMLYDSLATPGYLVLGEVEMPTGKTRARLECLDKKARIYRKLG